MDLLKVTKLTTYKGMQKRIRGYVASCAAVRSDECATPEAAKKQAADRIIAACDLALPQVVTLRGLTAFVGADRGEWYYLCPRDYAQELPGIHRTPSQVSGFASAQAAASAAFYHIAQNAWGGTEEDGEQLARLIDAYDSQSPSDCKAADFRDWVTFQLRYKRAIAAGATDAQAHHAACMRADYVAAE